MRPTEISINGFRSYRAGRPTVVDFRELETAAIVGDTGAGKSSILEALTWALFGEISSGAKVLQHVMNDNAERMNVRLGFETSERAFIVHRAARRTRKGNVVADGVLLTETSKTGDRAETTLAEGATAVLRKIRELIGMNCDAFLRTTILPQGRFSRLLAEDDQAIRAAVLRQIWSTDEIDDAQEITGRAASRLRALRIRGDQERSGKPENLAAHETELEVAAQADEEVARREADSVRRHRDAASKETDARQTAAAANKLHLGALETVKQLGETRDLPHLRSELKKLAERRTACREQVETLDVEWRESPGTADPEAAENQERILEKFETHIRTTDQAIQTRTDIADDLPQIGARAETAATAATTAEKARAERQRELDGADEAIADARAALQTLSDQRQDVDQTVHDIESTKLSVLAHVQQKLDKIRAEESKHTESAAALHAKVDAAKGAWSEANDALANAQRLNHAAAASSSTVSGDPCPVCERPLPGGWSAPQAKTLETLREAGQAADETLENLKADAARADAAKTEAGRTAASYEAEIGQTQAKLAEMRLQLGAKLELTHKETTAPECELSGAVLAARDRLAESIGTVTNRVETLEAKRTTAVQHLQHAAAAAAEGRHAADARSQELTTTRTRLATTLEGLEELVTTWMALARKVEPGEAVANKTGNSPTASGLGPRGTPESLTRMHTGNLLNAIQGIREKNRTRSRERDALQQRQLAAHEALQGASAAYDDHRDVKVAPLETLERTMRATLDRIAEQLDMTGKSAEHGATAWDTAKRIAETADRHHALTVTLLTTAIEVLETELRTVPTAERADAAGWLEKRHEEALKRAAASRWQLETFRQAAPAIRELDQLVADTTTKLEKLDELRRNLGGGQFPKYVTLRRSASLLAHASRHLRAMTADRYAFLDPRDTEEQWTVLDRHTMHTREPGQLSGGEQFLASVALALGAVETVSRIGGRIQTLFIDEGFGALDRGSLRRAIKGIHAASKERHLIVLVSHVREVAAAADDVIFVELGPDGGSTATTLDERQKTLLTDPEADDAAGDLLAAP